MVDVTHDWDEESYEETLEKGYEEYRRACYGDAALLPQQIAETKQAFLSGVHWLAGRENYDPVELQAAVGKIVFGSAPASKKP